MKVNRREFLKSSLMAGGGLMFGSGISFEKGSQSEVLRLGIIGTGDRGKGLSYLINEIAQMEVVACCDIIPFRLKEGMAIATKAIGYDDHLKLLDSADVDAVIIATPFSTHDQIALDSLNAGKHVYCEKTMVRGIKETQNVVDAHRSSDLVFQTGHQYHSSPLYNRVRYMIHEGFIGELTAFECQWNRNGDWRRPVPDPKLERLINWRMYKEYSGGLVAELCSHQIDFVNWVLGSQPERISGFGGVDHWKDGRETFDNVHLLFEYPEGIDASFTCTTTNSHEGYQIKILGSKGTIVLNNYTGEVFLEPESMVEQGVVDGVSGATIQSWKKGEGVTIPETNRDPSIDALKQFYDSVVNGTSVVSNIETGAITSKCVHIALDALQKGKVRHWKSYPRLKFS